MTDKLKELMDHHIGDPISEHTIFYKEGFIAGYDEGSPELGEFVIVGFDDNRGWDTFSNELHVYQNHRSYKFISIIAFN